MADHNELWLLNRLIELCRDEEMTLRDVANHVKAPEARALILDLAQRRAQFAETLVPHAQRLGGFNASSGSTLGALHRRWLGLRHALLKADDEAMLRDVMAEEGEIASIYDDTLSEMLPPAARDAIEAQRAEIEQAQSRVKSALRH